MNKNVIYYIEPSVLQKISNMRDSVSSGYPNNKKRVENMTYSRVFLTKFEVFTGFIPFSRDKFPGLFKDSD